MQELIQKIEQEAYVTDDKIVKVDHFINHMLDTDLVFKIGEAFSKAFPQATKILTIEASGIAFAVATAFHLHHIPIVFAKKKSKEYQGDHIYQAPVVNYNQEKDTNIVVDEGVLSSDDKVLIIDDFLATGSTLWALVNIARQAGSIIEGAGIVIEKGFINARRQFEAEGIKIHSLANIQDIRNKTIYF